MQHIDLDAVSPTVACHNCRQGRRRCDRSIPACLKCQSRAQECLGYGTRLKWMNGISTQSSLGGPCTDQFLPPTTQSRGSSSGGARSDLPTVTSQRLTALDPDELDVNTIFYLNYFDTRVCKDLVLRDSPNSNAFRELLPLSERHPMLQHIIVANAALHLANASRIATLKPSCTNNALEVMQSGSTSQAHQDALVSKQKALILLASSLSSRATDDNDARLATIMMFIFFELLDSGTNDWKFHIDGAKQLIAYLHNNAPTGLALQNLRSTLISNCVVYDVFGSTFATTETKEDDGSLLSSIREEELANTCLSCPPVLLQIIRDVTSLARRGDLGRLTRQHCEHLLSVVRDFDVASWVGTLQQVSSSFEFDKRLHLGAAYRAAVTIYVIRATATCKETAAPLEDLVADVLMHLEVIPVDDWFFKSTFWPTFIAGAETDDPLRRAAVAERFRQGIIRIPWGYLAQAENVLHDIWSRRDDKCSSMEWLAELKSSETDWLIA